MTINEALSDLCEKVRIKNDEDFYTSIKEIAKKLNSIYYDLDGDSSSHMYVVGSVGRKTAVKNASDIDVLFDLPRELFLRFDSYESNGQSALLQEVKGIIADRYPRTELKGDGQVISISFDKYTVELVPAFIQEDNTFLYPDSHGGGKWKKTDPLAEQQECKRINNENPLFYKLCRLTRKWKNNIGFEFKGLLIDTLVHDFIEESDEEGIGNAFIGVIRHFANQDRDRTYWYALGSNQRILNDDGSFVVKAQKVLSKIEECKSSEELNDVFADMLGRNYPKQRDADLKEKMQLRLKGYADTEEFIEDYVPVDIRYRLNIDCEVKQNGFRSFSLREFLRSRASKIKFRRDLDFFIEYTNCPEPFDAYWKVKNVGPVAIERDEVRGQIIAKKGHMKKLNHHETSKFNGPHYVECYLIKGGVCVARDRISVPIGDEE